MKYCPKCGTPNDDNALFCKQCGAQLPMMGIPSAPQQNIPQGPSQQAPPQYPSGAQQQSYPPPQGSYQPPPYGPAQQSQLSQFSNPDTYVLIALIFAGISVLVFFVEFIYSIFSLLSLSSYVASLGPSYSYLYAGAIAGEYVAIFSYIIAMAIGALVALRVWKLYNLVKQRRYQEAYQQDTVLWGVLGIIFGLIITGVFLLLLRGQLETALRTQTSP